MRTRAIIAASVIALTGCSTLGISSPNDIPDYRYLYNYQIDVTCNTYHDQHQFIESVAKQYRENYVKYQFFGFLLVDMNTQVAIRSRYYEAAISNKRHELEIACGGYTMTGESYRVSKSIEDKNRKLYHGPQKSEEERLSLKESIAADKEEVKRIEEARRKLHQ